jgi:hypothetical protein
MPIKAIIIPMGVKKIMLFSSTLAFMVLMVIQIPINKKMIPPKIVKIAVKFIPNLSVMRNTSLPSCLIKKY